MRAGLIESDAYLEGWRRATRTCGPDLETEVAEEAERLEAAHDRATLLGLTRTGGVRED
jgi:hypothetical protein